MTSLIITVVIFCHVQRIYGYSDVKRVLSTTWWPPGTEKKDESIGILSRGTIFMTSMMEHKQNDTSTMYAEGVYIQIYDESNT